MTTTTTVNTATLLLPQLPLPVFLTAVARPTMSLCHLSVFLPRRGSSRSSSERGSGSGVHGSRRLRSRFGRGAKVWDDYSGGGGGGGVESAMKESGGETEGKAEDGWLLGGHEDTLATELLRSHIGALRRRFLRAQREEIWRCEENHLRWMNHEVGEEGRGPCTRACNCGHALAR